MVIHQPVEAKSILNRMKVIDSWFWCRYTMNPYQGCEHACVYCDARSDRYYLHDDFDETIVFKANAPAVLEKKLKSSRTFLPDVVAMAGMCDAYQPIENERGVTHKLLEILQKYRFPVFISTKSVSIQKDLDLLNAIGRQTKAVVAFTVTTLDEPLAAFFEPRAANPWDRIKMIGHIKKHYPHITVGVNFMPIIPLFEDSPENISLIIQEAAKAGANFLLAAPGVTLRDSQGAYFMRKLKVYCDSRSQPDLYRQFEHTFGPKGTHPQAYYRQKQALIAQLCAQWELAPRIKRWIPSDFRKSSYLAAEVLLNHADRLKRQGAPYMDFFWAAQALHNLSEPLENLAGRGGLKTALKFSPEIRRVIAPFTGKPTNLDAFLPKPKESS